MDTARQKKEHDMQTTKQNDVEQLRNVCDNIINKVTQHKNKHNHLGNIQGFLKNLKKRTSANLSEVQKWYQKQNKNQLGFY